MSTYRTILHTRAAVLLGLRGGETYGTDLIDRVLTITEDRIAIHHGRLYDDLLTLRRQGLIEFTRRERPMGKRGGRPRQYMKLTPKGVAKAQHIRDALLALIGPIEDSSWK